MIRERSQLGSHAPCAEHSVLPTKSCWDGSLGADPDQILGAGDMEAARGLLFLTRFFFPPRISSSPVQIKDLRGDESAFRSLQSKLRRTAWLQSVCLKPLLFGVSKDSPLHTRTCVILEDIEDIYVSTPPFKCGRGNTDNAVTGSRWRHSESKQWFLTCVLFLDEHRQTVLA